jgi:hypothetical protein
MHHGKTGWTALAVALAVVSGGVIWSNQAETVRLRRELVSLREQEQKRARAAEEHDRLLAAAVAPERLAELRAARVELERFRREVPAAVRPGENLAPTEVLNASPGALPPIPVSACKNVGRNTPIAAVETMLWAAAGGDIDQLAAAIMFNPERRQSIDEQFLRLPPTVQKEYGSPERLVAYFTTQAVPLGSREILSQKQIDPDQATVAVKLQAPDGTAKTALLSLRRAEDGWRLQVPDGAFMGYVRTIRGIDRPANAAMTTATPAP